MTVTGVWVFGAVAIALSVLQIAEGSTGVWKAIDIVLIVLAALPMLIVAVCIAGLWFDG